MAPKTIKQAIAETLEDLSKMDYEKFRSHLLDRRDEPRVRRNKVEDKGFLVVTDVLVSNFTETGALPVVLELLREIDCNEDARKLGKCATKVLVLKAPGGRTSNPEGLPPEKATSALSSERGSSDTATASAGATGGNTTGGGDEHFVDKHRPQLISKVRYLSPILDELLHKKVINQEVYDIILALPTPRDRMRELYRGPLQGGTACKDIFYKSLEKHEPFLIKDLKMMK